MLEETVCIIQLVGLELVLRREDDGNCSTSFSFLSPSRNHRVLNYQERIFP